MMIEIKNAVSDGIRKLKTRLAKKLLEDVSLEEIMDSEELSEESEEEEIIEDDYESEDEMDQALLRKVITEYAKAIQLENYLKRVYPSLEKWEVLKRNDFSYVIQVSFPDKPYVVVSVEDEKWQSEEKYTTKEITPEECLFDTLYEKALAYILPKATQADIAGFYQIEYTFEEEISKEMALKIARTISSKTKYSVDLDENNHAHFIVTWVGTENVA